ncbi:MAG: nitronate monooxygenase [Clostridiales bacterium]|nr:nitronate monooxygenase [Clostridiales bacterium]MCF8022337.1 nitronate monooxygenase [Clostridiales bacterium]
MKLPQLQIGNILPKFPIVQGGMALRVSTAPLASAVANAGGIGVLGATGMSEEELREEIRKTRRLTSGPLGVNIMFAIKNFPKMVYTAIEEKIDVIFTGAGFSRDIFHWSKESGVPVVSIVSSTKLAVLAEKLGASAVVVEGVEAGGHLGTDKPLTEILPSIRKAINIPLIAAGGIIDGKGIAKMLQLGADGVQMATRFVLSKECDVSDSFKQMYLKAKPEDVVIIPSPVGLPGRALHNPFASKIIQGEKITPENCDNCLKKCSKQYCIMKALDNSCIGNVNEGIVFAGKNVHKIKDILPVQEIFNRLIREAKEN